MGGNAVIQRNVFDRIGLYSPTLGRSGKGFCRMKMRSSTGGCARRVFAGCMCLIWLLPLHSGGAPYPQIPSELVLLEGVSQGVLARESNEPVAHTLGVPRYRIGRAFKGMVSLPFHLLSRGGSGKAFSDEFASWDLAGFIYGRHFARFERLYAKQ